jgi:hypothetical protein
MVGRQVSGDPEQPGQEWQAAALVLGQRPKRLEKDLLSEISSVRWSDPQLKVPVNPVNVSFV